MTNKNMFDIFSLLNSNQLQSLKVIEDTCSNLQCAWLSGYFWNLAQHKTKNTVIQKNNIKSIDPIITIISASQTGNAALLSKRLNKYFQKNKKNTRLINAFDYKIKNLKNEKILILIVSTQGEGEPPEEALPLYKYIISKQAPKLNHLYYSIFALGDKSYDLFCQSGKDFDKRFQELGGNVLLDRFDADIEYEDDYKTWSKKLLENLNSINILPEDIKNQHYTSHSFETCTKNNPVIAKVLVNQKITGRYSTKDIRHIEIDISNLNIKYQPGDALGVWYQNDIYLVQKFITLFSLKSSEIITVKNHQVTVLEALKNFYELTSNTKNILKDYANLTKNKDLKNILSNKNKLETYISRTSLIDMLSQYPSNLSPLELISFLRPLKPRLYSISSSQEEVNDEIHITVGVVKKIISGNVYLGAASGYLSKLLKMDEQIKIFVETNNNFRLPKNPETDIIMICSGTGIAPFRAFMQQRENDKSIGKNWIFFGNPNYTEDFLYQTEWQRYIKIGLLTKMSLAWSRDQSHKVYVQDKILQNGTEIWSWIDNGAQIYVCGNASKMAKDVEKALLSIIMQNSGINSEKADEFLNNLRLNKRYQRDVY